MSRRSKYQTINLRIRFQRWQWRHQLILETTIHHDTIYLWDRIYETNFNRKESYLITKSDDSADMRRRIFSDDNDIREQSKRYCSDQKFSISRTNQAHWHSNSLHQRKNDRKIHRLSLRVYRSNDSWRFDKIINQKQICSVSRCFRNRIAISSFSLSARRSRDSNLWKFINSFFRNSNLWKSINLSATVICESQIMNRLFQWKLNQVRIWSHHFFLYNFRSLLNVDFEYKRWVRKKNFRL